jgi:hypothetical protein
MLAPRLLNEGESRKAACGRGANWGFAFPPSLAPPRKAGLFCRRAGPRLPIRPMKNPPERGCSGGWQSLEAQSVSRKGRARTTYRAVGFSCEIPQTIERAACRSSSPLQSWRPPPSTSCAENTAGVAARSDCRHTSSLWPSYPVDGVFGGKSSTSNIARSSSGSKDCAFAATNRNSDAGVCRYLIAAQTFENVMFNCVPILSTAARIAIEIVPAMRACSMAVVADSSRRN